MDSATTGIPKVITIGATGLPEDIALLDCLCWLENEDGDLVYSKAAGVAATISTVVPTLAFKRDGLYDFTFTPDTPATGSGEWVYKLDSGSGLEVYDRVLVSSSPITMPALPDGSPYADATSVAAYNSALTIPADIDRLCARASDLVDYITLGNLDITDTSQATAAQYATCAQVERWILHGEDDDTGQAIRSYSKGKVSIQYAGHPWAEKELCARSRRYLMNAGLLYAGVTVI